MSATISARTKGISILISTAPFVIALIFVIKYAYNLPIWDQWALVPYLQKMFAHENISLSELMQQHNEHRILFPRLIMLGLAKFTHWNICVEIYTGLALLALSYLFIYFSLFKTFNSIRQSNNVQIGFIFCCFLCSVLMFSTNQYQNLLWGWQIQIFLDVLCVILTVFFLTKEKRVSIFDYLCAIVFALIATFSFANGMLAWVIGAAMLWIRRAEISQFAIKFGMWLVAFVVTIGIYRFNLSSTKDTPSLESLIDNIDRVIYFIFSYFGAPILRMGIAARVPSILAGILGAAAICLLIVLLVKRNALWDKALLFWHGMLLYSLISAGLTSIGRYTGGLFSAMESRYITISLFFWLWIFVVGLYTICSFYSLNIKAIWASSILYACIFMYYTRANFIDAQDNQNRNPLYIQILTQSTVKENLKTAEHIYPFPLQIIKENEYLKRQHLSFYYIKH